MKRILFLGNGEIVIYNFRLEIIEQLIQDGHEVHVSCPYGERIDELTKLGVKFHDTKINRHGTNPFEDLRLFHFYKELLNEIKPDICFGFTIKPNIYGSIAAHKYKIPFIANITGLGTAVEKPGINQTISVLLYKYAFRYVKKVFFQNEENKNFFIKKKIPLNSFEMLPGSGVNLMRFPYKKYPKGDVVKFAFISRIMKEKGIEIYLKAANTIREKYKNTEFHICGFCEPEYNGRLAEMNNKGVVIYHGMIDDTSPFIGEMHCIVHPSYYPEGLSNTLLEACATGRPVITTNRSGCREVVDDGVNGFIVPCQNCDELIKAIETFLNLSWNKKMKMGIEARKKVESKYDRQIVVEKYVETLNKT